MADPPLRGRISHRPKGVASVVQGSLISILAGFNSQYAYYRIEDMRQYAPDPEELDDIIKNMAYRPGWTFDLKDIERDPEDTHGAAAGGLTFIVFTDVMDAYHPQMHRRVYHYIPVPAATFNRAAWERWVFDRLVEIETHEAAEYYQVEDRRPMAPTHGPGDNPYTVVQYATDEQRNTSFQGKVKA